MNWKMLGAVVALVMVFEVGVTGQNQGGAGGAGASKEQLIARGKYLTHDVAMCVQCHSPKDEYGRVMVSKEFQGGAIPVANPFAKGRRWASNAPALTSLVANREEAVFHLLTTGTWTPSGESPLMPMPPFRLSEDDARAVIAYLKTV